MSQHWDKTELYVLKREYGRLGPKVLAKTLPKTYDQIRNMAQVLELTNPGERRRPLGRGSYSTRYSPEQLTALDSIGKAYQAPGEGTITFEEAAELREYVLAGENQRALRLLKNVSKWRKRQANENDASPDRELDSL